VDDGISISGIGEAHAANCGVCLSKRLHDASGGAVSQARVSRTFTTQIIAKKAVRP